MKSKTLPPVQANTPRTLRFPDAGDLLGAHISTKGGVCSVFERADAINANAIALFAKNSNQWKGKDTSDEECADFAARRGDPLRRPMLTHASYLINLATTNPEFHKKSLAGMIDELQRADRLGVHAVVLHPGAHLGEGWRKGVDQIARSLDLVHEAIPECRVVTLLETAAGQGSCVGCSFEELGAIIDLVSDKSRVAICFDTCHVFAAGFELRTREGYEATIDSLMEHVGLENVGAFHLNDSKKPLGSRVDRHQHIGEGEIGLEAFRMLLNDARFHGVPKVLETPKTIETESDLKNLTLLRSLIA